MIVNLIIYNFILFVSVFFAYFSSKTDSRVFSFTFMLYSFLVILIPTILRYDVGPDYKGYVGIFNDIYNGYGKPGYVEYLYFYVNYLFSFVPHGYIYVLGGYFFVSLVLLYKFSKKEYLYYFVFFFMTLSVGYFTFDDQVRQSLAMCVFLYACKYIEKNNFIRYCAICLISGLIHTSAILLLPMYFLAKMKISKNIMFFTMTFFVFCFYTGITQQFFRTIFSILPFFSDYSSKSEYLDADEAIGTGLGVLLNVITFSLCFIYRERLSSKYYVNILFWGVILLLFSAGNLNISRMAKYFLLLGVFLVSELFLILENKVVKLVFVFLLLIFFQKTIIHRYEINQGYKTIINEDIEINMLRERIY